MAILEPALKLFSFLADIVDFRNFADVRRLREEIGNAAGHAFKASGLGKKGTKREFWDAFAQLSLEEQDKIEDMMFNLRFNGKDAAAATEQDKQVGEQMLEYFQLQIAMTGEGRDASVAVLKSLAAKPTVQEAVELAKIMDLTQPPSYGPADATTKIKETAIGVRESIGRSVDNSGLQAWADRVRAKADRLAGNPPRANQPPAQNQNQQVPIIDGENVEEGDVE